MGSDRYPIFVSLGANLPRAKGSSPLETCRWAAAALDALPGFALRALSRWYRTAPVPASDQPDFVNAVAHLAVDGPDPLDPADLLARLHRIEQEAGRTREVRNAARPLDLDIVAIGPLIRPAPDPILPHPRAHLRGFVLFPLRDVAPGWVHPVWGVDVGTLIEGLSDQHVRVVNE
jgi:2-amino-4-hydroxy-6-hydroxymethyldihydropteridine diphosphokinase